MSLQGIITSNIAIGGSNFNSSTTITDSGQIGADVTLTAGQAGTLSTYTSTTEGTATLSAITCKQASPDVLQAFAY